MKYLIIVGIFVVGISLGYVVGTHTAQSEDAHGTHAINQSDLTQHAESSDKNDRKLNAAESTLEEMKHENDSTNTLPGDSIQVDFMQLDSAMNEDHISTEKLIKSVYIPIVYLDEEINKDTIMQDLLGIEEVKNNNMFVEFWESPLNFEGYKLSKKKLIVYGLSSQFDYKLYKDKSAYFFSYQNIYYKMKETQVFLPFVEVPKSDVFHD